MPSARTRTTVAVNPGVRARERIVAPMLMVDTGNGQFVPIMEPRLRKLNDLPSRQADHVLYWMRWNRRGEANHALAFAAETANRLGLPLLVCETEDLGSDRQRQ